ATVPAGEPAAAVLPAAGPGDPARILLCWLDRPGTGSSSLRWAIGTVGSPAPAVLTGERSSPLPVPHRGLLVLRREYGPPRGVSFARTDFADPAAPTAAEVAALINLRGGGLCVADVTAGGRLRLTATAAGGDVQLTVDMRLSTVADALGFSADTGTAYGAWGDAVSWGQAQGVPAVADGWLADLVAVPDGAGARLAYARHDAVAWQVRTVRFDGTGWTADEALTSGTHSSREPALLREDTGRIIAVWAQQAAVAAARWSLRRRNRDPGTGAWDAEAVVTAAPVADAEGDRQPALALDPGGAVALYFRSDRGGGASLWQQPLAGGPASVIAPGPAADGWPAPVDVAGRRWLLYRSDRPVPHTRVGAGSAADLGTLRQYAGATTLVPAAVDRLNRRHAWDDLLAYTPCRPEGESAQQPLRDDELYTRGTVGLYLVQTVSGPLDEQMANRLRSVLQRFLPQNTRAVVWLAPTADVEVAYPPGADLIDSFLDKHPDIDHFGAPGEQVTVALPGWRLLLSARPATPPPADPAAGGTSADPAHPASLRARSYAPPPQ
ncbi:MAG: hypothetical protein J2P15_11500, partial [Micromonosporaceae bacterium]|nr:hypothetical protein [Micromonosporaceae bacterium]